MREGPVGRRMGEQVGDVVAGVCVADGGVGGASHWRSGCLPRITGTATTRLPGLRNSARALD